jgi:hypothetical protein
VSKTTTDRDVWVDSKKSPKKKKKNTEEKEGKK